MSRRHHCLCLCVCVWMWVCAREGEKCARGYVPSFKKYNMDFSSFTHSHSLCQCVFPVSLSFCFTLPAFWETQAWYFGCIPRFSLPPSVSLHTSHFLWYPFSACPLLFHPLCLSLSYTLWRFWLILFFSFFQEYQLRNIDSVSVLPSSLFQPK